MNTGNPRKTVSFRRLRQGFLVCSIAAAFSFSAQPMAYADSGDNEILTSNHAGQPIWSTPQVSTAASSGQPTSPFVDYGSMKMPTRGSTPQEILAYRTAYSQTFLNPDGTLTTHIWQEPQFYRDASHAWQKIDNTLIQSHDPNFAYQNAANNFVADFGAVSHGSPIKFSKDGDSVEFQLQKASSSAQDSAQGNKMDYTNILPNTDLEYHVLGNGLKESIILHSASAPSSFSYTLNLKGLSYKQEADGSIELTDSRSKLPIAWIQAPYMYDANGATSTQVKQSITQNADGSLTLTLTPDASWLSSPDRVYPVTLDPTLSNVPASGTVDTFLSSTYPNNNYTSQPSIDAGSSSYYGTMRALINFQNLPALLPGATGATIQKATLSLYQYFSNEGGMAVQAVPITSSWSPTSVDWSNQPTYGSVLNTQSQATSNISSTNPSVGTWDFDVTPAVQQWYSGTLAGNGIELLGGTSSYAQFASSENTTYATPELSVTYTVTPVGDENFWTQTNDGVNVANGNLELSQTDLSIPGRGYSVSVDRTYNSLNAGASIPGHTNLFGNGWTSNLDMSLSGTAPGPYVFTDASGLQHLLVLNPTTGEYMASPADHLTLTPSNGTTDNVITELDGTQLHFNPSTGKLTSIVVPSTTGTSDTTSLTYNSSGQLSGITDASGRTWSVTTNTNGTIASVTDPAGRVATYSYDSNGNLTGVTISSSSGSTDTTSTSYGYNTSSQLTSCTNPNGVTTSYTYSGNQISTVSQPLTVGGSTTTSTDTYTYGADAQNDPTTTVTDAAGHSILYTLDNTGNVTQKQVDPNGLNLTSQYMWDNDEQLTSYTDPNGNTTAYSYDNSDSDLGVPSSGLPISMSDPLSNNNYDVYNPYASVAGSESRNGAVASNTFNKTLPTDVGNSLSGHTMVDYTSKGLVQQASAPVNLGQNLIPNGNFEFISGSYPTDWQTNAGNGTITDTTSTAMYGTHSVEIQAGTTSPTDLGMNDYINANPNQTYNLSLWVKTSGVGGASANGGLVGAVLNAHWYKNSSGTVVAASGTKYGTGTYLDNMIGTNGWTRITTQITAPSDATLLKFNLVLYGTTGTAWWDGVQLEPIDDFGTTNWLVNSTFLDTPPGETVPANWGASNSGDWIDNSTLHNGYPSFILYGGSSTNDLYQYINDPSYSDPSAGWDGVMISGWSEQSGATAPSGSTTYDLRLRAYYSDGTPPVDVSVPFTVTTNGWQHVQTDVPLATFQDASGNLPKDFIFYADYDNQTGNAWFNSPQVQFLSNSGTVGSYDLLENPGFEYSYNPNNPNWPDYWNTATGNGSAVWQTIAQGDTDVHSGQGVMVLHPSTSGTTPEAVQSSVQVPYSSQTTYTLTGYVRTSDLKGDHAYIRLDAIAPNGTASFKSQAIGSSTADTNGNADWTRVDVVLPPSSVPSGTTSLTAAIAVDPDTNGSNASAYFDDLSLVPYNEFSSNQYDSNSNYVTQSTDESGNTVKFAYGSNNTGSGYSANFTGANTGDPSQVTDPIGNTSSFSYNKFDQITGYTYPYQNNGSTTNETFQYSYDQDGNLLSIQDPNGHQVTYQYNQMDELSSQTEAVSGTAMTTTESYNKDGTLASVSNPNGTSESYSYDAADRVTGKTDTKGSSQDSFSFEYDKVGNLTSAAENSNPALTFGYDRVNRLTSVTAPFSSTVNNTESITLDPSGNVNQIQYTLGNSTPASWTETDLYNLGNELTSTNDGNDKVLFSYTPRGQLSSTIDNSSNTTTYYSYNPNGELAEVRTINYSGTNHSEVVLADYTYLYYPNGNVKQITNNAVSPATSIAFNYDSLNQLTSETTWTGDTITYTYDDLGNRTSVTDSKAGTTTTYSYDPEGNRLTAVGRNNVTYDQNGQMTAFGSTNYSWNAENELSQVTYGTTTDTYSYDTLGRRSVVNGDNIGYIGQSNLVGYVTDSNNNLLERFVYNDAGLPVLMYINIGGSWHEYGYVYDGLGEITGLVDDTGGSSTLGQEVVTYQYDAWGNLLGAPGDKTTFGLAQQNPFIYKGYWYDWDTGLYYLNARYYNPTIGRFLSEDPVAPSVGDTLSYNEYLYVRNNPVNMVDPAGSSDEFQGFLAGLSEQQIIAMGEEGLVTEEAQQLARNYQALERELESGAPTKGTGNLLQASSKSEGLASVGDLPENIQSSVKSFFKGGSTKYTDFSVKQESNGNYVASMVKPGNVPGSKAIYYKVISPEGETISVYKDTFDPAGNLVHSKPKN